MMRAYGQQRLVMVERTLAALPPKVATTLLLHRHAGLSVDEIAAELGVSRAAVKKYLAKALAECRTVLEDEDKESSP